MTFCLRVMPDEVFRLILSTPWTMDLTATEQRYHAALVVIGARLSVSRVGVDFRSVSVRRKSKSCTCLRQGET